MRKALAALLLALTLSSCAALEGTVDHAADRTERLVTHTTEEIRALKTEVLAETKEAISELKTETLREVQDTVEEMTPRLVDQVLNTESVAFLIVAVTGLLGLVVVVALILLLGAARTTYRRLRHPKGCSARPQDRG